MLFKSSQSIPVILIIFLQTVEPRRKKVTLLVRCMESLYSHTCGLHQFTLLSNRNLIKQQLPGLRFLPASYCLLQIQSLHNSTNSQGNELSQKITNPPSYRAGSWSGNSLPVSQVSVITGLQAALFKVRSPRWEHSSIHTQDITTSKFHHSHFFV